MKQIIWEDIPKYFYFPKSRWLRIKISMTLPFSYTFILSYYVIPVVVFIFYVLASLELIAEEIEDPFGSDANDLPTEKIAANIKKHVDEIFVTK